MSADPFAGFADLVEEAPVQRGAVQTSKAGKVGRVDTATTPAVRATSNAAADTAKLAAFLGADPFAGKADLVGAPPAAPRPAPALTAAEVISPANAQSQMEGQSWPRRMVASGLDAATLVPRLAAGVGGGLGTLAGGGSLSDAGAAFAQDMAHPSQTAQEQTQAGNVPTWQKWGLSPQMYAGMAESPLTMALAPVGASEATPEIQALSSGLASYLSNTAGRYVNGETPLQAATGETTGQQIADVAPLGFAALPGAVAGVQRGASALSRGIVQSILKPTKGEQAESIRNLLATVGPDAGVTHNPLQTGKDIAETYLAREGEILKEYPATLQSLDKVAAGNPDLNFPVSRLLPAIQSGFKGSPLQGPNALARQQDAIEAVLGEIKGANPTPGGEAFLFPSGAHQIKKALARQSNWVDPSGKAVLSQDKKTAFEAASRDIGNWLKQTFPEYADLTARERPYAAARDALEKARDNSENRNIFGLTDLIGGGAVLAHPSPVTVGGAILAHYTKSGAGAKLAAGLGSNPYLFPGAEAAQTLGLLAPLAPYLRR